MSGFFVWCCRRIRRGNSPETNDGKDGKDNKARSKSANRKSKHKKGTQEEETLEDLSLVRRETEVLRAHKKPPPPRNRARASRVLRTMKTANSVENLDIVQEEEDEVTKPLEKNGPVPKESSSSQEAAEEPDPVKETSHEAVASHSDAEEENSSHVVKASESEDSGLSHTSPFAQENLTNQSDGAEEANLSDEAEDANQSNDEQPPDDVSSDKEEAEKVESDQEDNENTPSQEPIDNQEEPEQPDSPKLSQGSEEKLPETTSKDSVNGSDSVNAYHRNSNENNSNVAGNDNDDGNDHGDENVNDDEVCKEDGEDVAVFVEDKTAEDDEQEQNTSALANDVDTTTNNATTEEEVGMKKPLRTAASCTYPPVLPKPLLGKKKHLSESAVHGEVTSQSLASAQSHLKEAETDRSSEDKTAEQEETTDSDNEAQTTVRSHSEATD